MLFLPQTVAKSRPEVKPELLSLTTQPVVGREAFIDQLREDHEKMKSDLSDKENTGEPNPGLN